MFRQQQIVLQGEIPDSLAGKNSKLCTLLNLLLLGIDIFVSNHIGFIISLGNGADKESISERAEEGYEFFEFSQD